MELQEKVSIIIVSYNAIDYVSKCISSIIKYSEKYNYEIIVIDNNSEGHVVKKLEEMHSEGQMQSLLKNKENILLTRAQNQGLKLADGGFILFLNPDTEIFDKNWLTDITKPFENTKKKIGISGPIYNFFPLKPMYGNIDMCCFCISRRLFEELGYLDERYPWNGAGFAYTCEAWARGYRHEHVKTSSVKHHGSKSRASKSIPNVHYDLRKEMKERGLNPKYSLRSLLKHFIQHKFQ